MDLSNSLADLSKGESVEQVGEGDGAGKGGVGGAGARVAAIFVGHLGACSLSQTGPHECSNTFLKTLVTGNRELALGNEGGSIHKKPTG